MHTLTRLKGYTIDRERTYTPLVRLLVTPITLAKSRKRKKLQARRNTHVHTGIYQSPGRRIARRKGGGRRDTRNTFVARRSPSTYTLPLEAADNWKSFQFFASANESLGMRPALRRHVFPRRPCHGPGKGTMNFFTGEQRRPSPYAATLRAEATALA